MTRLCRANSRAMSVMYRAVMLGKGAYCWVTSTIFPVGAAGLAVDADFAAAWRIRCDHRLAAGRRFQQAHRQAFAVRWQHREMATPPERGDIVDVPEPGDAGLAAPGLRFLERNGRRIGRIGI